MYAIMDKRMASKKHREYATHHIENYMNGNSRYNVLEAIIDYECARFTKVDKPENAYETANTKADYINLFSTGLIKFDINSPERINIDFKEVYDIYCKFIKTDYITKNISVLIHMINAGRFNTIDEIVNNFYIRLSYEGL